VLAPDAFIQGEQLYLRALRERDAEGPYPDWFNDEEVCLGNSHHLFPYTKTAALDYIRDVRRRQDCLVLAITLCEDDRHIGNVALQSINPVSRGAEFAIVIGDRDSWGKGYGKEASRLILAHGFRSLNLHRVHCGTFEINAAMRRLAEYLGMQEEGRRREGAFKNGRFVDLLEYGVLRSEFDERWPASSPSKT
jgi:RimJ/RimL family protein N-acetyltransferase